MRSYAGWIAAAALVGPGWFGVLAAEEESGPAPSATVEELGFLAGCWEGDLGGGTVMRDSYTAPRGGAILGNSLVVRDGETVFFEFSRIADDGAGLAFHPYPNGDSTVSFALVSATPAEAVFENPEHDHPQRIVYRRDGDRLIAEIANLDGSRAQRFPMRGVPCAP